MAAGEGIGGLKIRWDPKEVSLEVGPKEAVKDATKNGAKGKTA